jgi:hypothetical protein
MTVQSSHEQSRPLKRVPFGDSLRQYQALKDELDAATVRVLQSGWYILRRDSSRASPTWTIAATRCRPTRWRR